MRRLPALPALALLFGAALAACFSSEPTPMEPPPDGGGTTVAVTMTNTLAFDPDPVIIEVGDTVEWTNTSGVGHTVTADASLAANPDNVVLPAGAEPFDSGFLGPGATYARTFTVAGIYQYVCLPHESAGMIGQVVVTP
ncbi:MAG: plastocyanin/azurin family copper-binding protein [Rubricoccaceae bacterium]|nr:plastocyanin/azurin family copper-binding protein [Rubricoccaceae bacterium]